jgi:Flp pilus assembly protein TadG
MIFHLTSLAGRLCERRATAAVEFALVSPVLLVLLMFVIDFGMYLYASLQLSNAVSAGAEYALVNGQSVQPYSACTGVASPCPYFTVSKNNNSPNLRDNIQTIVQQATSPALTATPTVYYNTSSTTAGDTDTVYYNSYCPSSTATPDNQTATTNACADGTQPGSYIAIVASIPYSPIFSGDTWLAGPTITKTTWVRVQ